MQSLGVGITSQTVMAALAVATLGCTQRDNERSRSSTPRRGLLARTAFLTLACGSVLSFAFATAFPTGARAQDKQADLRVEKLEKRIGEPRNNAVKSTRMPVQLVDGQGRPVKGAIASTYFQRDADRQPNFTVPQRHESATSNERGELTLSLAIPRHLDAAGIYAIREDQGLPIVGAQRVSREEIRDGKPVRVVMHPACRVRMRIECPEHVELAEKFHADLGGTSWWRSAYIWLGENHEAPRPLLASSTSGQIEFLLPPGRFMVMAYGTEVYNRERTIEVKPGHRVLNLGVIEVPPTDAFKQGIFHGYWRSIRRDARAVAEGLVGEERISFRPPRLGPGLDGDAGGIQDTVYSPDGALLATAHWYNGKPGEVKLWDAMTGKLNLTLPVTNKDAGVIALAFSPDGKILAGSVGSLAKAQPPGVVVLWDSVSGRELKTLRGHSARITALAFTQDGRGIASGGEDRTVRFWDVASGAETGQIPGNHGWVRALAYAPDGKVLAVGSGTTLKLWDVIGNRPGATLEPDGFRVQSVAFAPDGRTLAGAGTAGGEGKVRLFNLTRTPPDRRAELTPHHEAGNPPNDWVGEVVFTPDGRRVAAVATRSVVIWNAATGDEEDSIERPSWSSRDRLAVSPDGRWLAVTEVGEVRIFDISPAGR